MEVLKYEIKGLVLTKKFFYINLVTMCFTYYVLSSLVIGGFSGTAPFSKLSYSNFLALINPILLVMLVFITMTVFSEKERLVRKIIFSTPISQSKYYMIKGISTLTATLLIAAVQVIFSFAFYGYLFGFYSYSDFILPILLFLFPPIILILGLSFILGRLNDKILYLIIPLVFVMGMLNISQPVWFDLCSNNFLCYYPLRLAASGYSADALPYIMPMDYVVSRILFVITGLISFALACGIKGSQFSRILHKE
jgi:hypothetical protein